MSLPRPSSRRLALRVTPDALRHIRSGHPWLFDSSIVSVSHDGAAGDLAVIFDQDRNFAAIGLYDPASPLRVKVLHHGRPVTIGPDFWWSRLEAAAAMQTRHADERAHQDLADAEQHEAGFIDRGVTPGRHPQKGKRRGGEDEPERHLERAVSCFR